MSSSSSEAEASTPHAHQLSWRKTCEPSPNSDRLMPASDLETGASLCFPYCLTRFGNIQGELCGGREAKSNIDYINVVFYRDSKTNCWWTSSSDFLLVANWLFADSFLLACHVVVSYLELWDCCRQFFAKYLLISTLSNFIECHETTPTASYRKTNNSSFWCRL